MTSNFILDELFDKIKTPWYKRMINPVKRIIRDAVYSVKYALQRLFRGYDDRAWWNMDGYLATIIAKLSKELKEKGHGAPTIIYTELGFDASENGSYSEEEQLLAEEKWGKILLDIEEGFQQYLEVNNCVLHPDADLGKFNKAFDLLRKYFSNLWD